MYEIIFGAYIGGSIVVSMFLFSGLELLNNKEKSFYIELILLWPIYMFAVLFIKLIKFIKGDYSG